MLLIEPDLIVAIVRDAGGEITGRTRLQKIAYLLEVVGFGNGFQFSYKHYGPFSEGVAASAMKGVILGHIKEVEEQAKWGGFYSVYSVDAQQDDHVPSGRCQLARRAKESNAVVLELAATAVFLSLEGYEDPWSETERRKPEKSESGRLEHAKELLAELKRISVPTPLPDIV